MFCTYMFGTGLIVFVTTYAEGRQSLDMLYTRLVYQMHSRMGDAIDNLASSVEMPAREVRFYDPSLNGCDVSDIGKGFEPLAQEYQAYSSLEGPMGKLGIESVGIVMRKPIEHQQPSANTSTNAYSWEVSAYPGCKEFVYSHSDSANWPQMHGFCGYYNGSEGALVIDQRAPQLEPIEERMYANPQAYEAGAFLPISRSWIDSTKFTLIYAVPRICEPNKTYAISYAEKSLAQLDEAVHYSGLAEEGNFDGTMVFVVEVTTGLLVASSVPNQTTDNDGNRILYTNASDAELRYAARLLSDRAGRLGLKMYRNYQDWQLGGEDGYLLFTMRITKTGGLDWLVVCAIPYKNVLGPINERASVSAIVYIVVNLLGMLVTCLTVYCCVSRPIRAIITRGEAGKNPPSRFFWISEVQLVAGASRIRKRKPSGKGDEEAADAGFVHIASKRNNGTAEDLETEISVALTEAPAPGSHDE